MQLRTRYFVDRECAIVLHFGVLMAIQLNNYLLAQNGQFSYSVPPGGNLHQVIANFRSEVSEDEVGDVHCAIY